MDIDDIVIDCIGKHINEPAFLSSTTLFDLGIDALGLISIAMDIEKETRRDIEYQNDYEDLLDLTVDDFTTWVKLNLK